MRGGRGGATPGNFYPSIHQSIPVNGKSNGKLIEIAGMSEIGRIWKENQKQKKSNRKLNRQGKGQIRQILNQYSKIDKKVDETMLQIRRNLQQSKEM